MNLKSLLQPTIDKIREDLREVVRQEERERNTKIVESWLEEQIRAGKIKEGVKPPVFGENRKGREERS